MEIPLERWDVDAYYDEDAEVRAVRAKKRVRRKSLNLDKGNPTKQTMYPLGLE